MRLVNFRDYMASVKKLLGKVITESEINEDIECSNLYYKNPFRTIFLQKIFVEDIRDRSLSYGCLPLWFVLHGWECRSFDVLPKGIWYLATQQTCRQGVEKEFGAAGKAPGKEWALIDQQTYGRGKLKQFEIVKIKIWKSQSLDPENDLLLLFCLTNHQWRLTASLNS